MVQTLEKVARDSPYFCDRCGARAAVLARKESLELAFCGHHSHTNAEKLKEIGFALFRIED